MTMVGEVLGGRYRLDALIGAGGMATVYRARDLRLERDVAVKVLSPNLAADQTLAARFEQEARFLAALSHPAIVAVYDVGAADGDPYFVMQLVEGESLAERLERSGPLPPEEAIPIVATIAGGLADLHARGFVHRDVKPHNILLGDGSPRLADFGLVRSDDATSELTAPGTTVGTLAYLAPELLRGGVASPASDVYALAVVAYRALTGRSPYPAEAVADLVDAQAGPVTPPSSLVPELGDSFDAPILAGLAEEGDRPDAAGLAEGLSDALEAWATQGSAATSPAAAGAEAATTVVPVVAGSAVGARPGWLERRRTRQSRHVQGEQRGRLLAAWIVGGAALLAGVGLLFALSGAFDRGPAASVAARTTATPRATPTPTKAPTQAPQGPFDAVIAAVADYRTALDGATGGRNGLRGNEAGDLRDLAARVEAAARDQNAEETRKRAEELRKKTEEEVRKAKLRGERADDLLAAARRVEEAAGRLTGSGGDGDD